MKYLIILFLLAVAICAWCPWITPKEAHQLINTKITVLQNSIPDLCPIQVVDNTITKVPFGFKEKLFYDCSKVDDTYGVEKSENTVFVTFYRGVIGMPNKLVKN